MPQQIGLNPVDQKNKKEPHEESLIMQLWIFKIIVHKPNLEHRCLNLIPIKGDFWAETASSKPFKLSEIKKMIILNLKKMKWWNQFSQIPQRTGSLVKTDLFNSANFARVKDLAFKKFKVIGKVPFAPTYFFLLDTIGFCVDCWEPLIVSLRRGYLIIWKQPKSLNLNRPHLYLELNQDLFRYRPWGHITYSFRLQHCDARKGCRP